MLPERSDALRTTIVYAVVRNDIIRFSVSNE